MKEKKKNSAASELGKRSAKKMRSKFPTEKAYKAHMAELARKGGQAKAANAKKEA